MKDIVEIDLGNKDIYIKKIWGNTPEVLSFVNKTISDVSNNPDDIIGEVFLVSTHPDGLSRFTNGKLLKDEVGNEESVFGKTITPKGEFPLLLKVLSAKKYLSIQTHYKNKVEAWYTLSDGEMLYGLTQEGEEILKTEEGRRRLAELLQKSSDLEVLKKYFNHREFQAGETYLIHAGLVHALLRGTVLEPQKNSNLTIRGGDWGRNVANRQLHLDDFFASIFPYQSDPRPISPKNKSYRTDKKKPKNSRHSCLVATSDFALDKISLQKGERMLETFVDRFFVVIVLSGDIELTNGVVYKKIKKGQIFILGATPNEWTFKGSGEILLTYVPHLKKGVIDPLKNSGYSYREITEIGGGALKENDVYIEMKERGLL